MSEIVAIISSVFSLKAITDEMSIGRWRRPPARRSLCEAKDFVTGLYDAEGRMLEQTENLPILSFSLAPRCASTSSAKLRRTTFTRATCSSTTTSSAGQPEQRRRGLTSRSSSDDQLVAWSATKGPSGRHRRCGGGGYNPNATEVWQEALANPACQGLRQGTMIRQDVWDLIFANVRL